MLRTGAQERARGAMGAEGNDTGGKDERLREHRIGHFRFQARGRCDCAGGVVDIDTPEDYRQLKESESLILFERPGMIRSEGAD